MSIEFDLEINAVNDASKKLDEEKEVISSFKEDLGSIEKEVKEKWLKTIIENIEKDPDIEIKSDKLSDFISQKDRWGAVKEFFNIVWRLFNIKNWTWFDEYNFLEDQIKGIDLDNSSKEKLSIYVETIQSYIEKTSDIKKDLKFTYILSKIKNQLIKITDSQPEINNYKLFKKNIKPWCILLFNKKIQKKDRWSDLLKAYDEDYNTDFTHSAIVSDVKDDWEIQLLHSTTDDYQKAWKSWGVREEPLKNYFERWNVDSCDFLVLEPSDVNKENIINYARSNKGKWYDNNAAIGWWLYKKDIEWNWFKIMEWSWKEDDYFNCVEIIAKWLDISWTWNITHPNDFLSFMWKLKPIYMTTIESKDIT